MPQKGFEIRSQFGQRCRITFNFEEDVVASRGTSVVAVAWLLGCGLDYNRYLSLLWVGRQAAARFLRGKLSNIEEFQTKTKHDQQDKQHRARIGQPALLHHRDWTSSRLWHVRPLS